MADVEHRSLLRSRDEISKLLALVGLQQHRETWRHALLHMAVHKMKQIVGFDSRNSVKSHFMCMYSVINMINKKILNHIITRDEKHLQYLVN